MNPNGLRRFGSPSNALKLTTASKTTNRSPACTKNSPFFPLGDQQQLGFHLTGGNCSTSMPEHIILGRCCSRASEEEWVLKNVLAVGNPSKSTRTCFQFNCMPRNIQVIGSFQKYYSTITAELQSGFAGSQTHYCLCGEKRLGPRKYEDWWCDGFCFFPSMQIAV